MEHADEQAIITEARALRARGMSLRPVAGTLATRGRFARSGRAFAASATAAMV